MSIHYQKFIKILEKWPIDKSKAGRDLGEKLRRHLQELSNPVIVGFNAQSEELNNQIDALDRLSNNVCGKMFQRKFKSTATGLSAEQCSQVLSSEFLNYLNEEKGFTK
ncbi:UQCC2 family protein [Megaselia abdita]